jgi:hypothetical protein
MARRGDFRRGAFPALRTGHTPVPRLDLLIVLVLAMIVGALTFQSVGNFQPLPLLIGAIAVGAWRSWKALRAGR